MGTRCSRCIMDSKVPGIVFDEKGECVYCKIHDALDRAYPTGKEGEKILEGIFEKIKAVGTGKSYDCIVGTSGGTDSTYLLYLTKKIGLRPLAVHLNNGWNSEIAAQNIRNAITKLGIDLRTYTIAWKEVRDLCVSFLKSSLPWSDVPADIAITSSLYKIARRENIKYIIVGNNFRTEGKQPTEWTYGDARLVKSIHRQFGTEKLETFPNLTLSDIAINGFIKKIKLVRPLYYLQYSKENAKAILKDELGWEYYGGHHYESVFTHFVLTYILPRKFGIDKRIVTLSAEVRSGYITRDEALATISSPPLPESEVEERLSHVLGKLELSREKFNKIMNLPVKSFTDYPSYYPLIRNFTNIMKFFVSFLLPWTPMIFYEMEARKKCR